MLIAPMDPTRPQSGPGFVQKEPNHAGSPDKSFSRAAPKGGDPGARASAPLIDRVQQLINRRQFGTAALLLPALERRGADAGLVQVMAAGIALARGDRDAAERIVDAALADHAANPALLRLRADMEPAER